MRNAEKPSAPLTLEIFRHALTGITDEMSAALRRAAYSTNIKTRLDFSCSLLDGRARTAAQSFAQPVHLGTIARFVPEIVRQFGVGDLRSGDAILCNDSHLGGLHLNDVCLVAPVIVDGEPFAKTIPSLLMAAASVDVPAVVLPGGPMLTGTFRGLQLGCGADVWRLSEEVRAGTFSEEASLESESSMIRDRGH